MKWSAPVLAMLRRKTSGGRYIPEIDGLRFIAIFLVLIQHLSERLLKHAADELLPLFEHSQTAFWAGRGTSGVFLFFTISGFILALPLIQKAENNTVFISFKSYLKRRLTRLEPPYVLWMSLFALVLWGQAAWSEGMLFKHWLASIFYIHNLVYGAYSVINPVAWSLEVEIQFYLIAPLLAWVLFSLLKKSQNAILIGGIGMLFVLQKLSGMDVMPWKASIFNCLQYFLLGYLLANLYRKGFLITNSKNLAYNIWWDIIGFSSLVGLYVFWSEELWKEFLFALSIFLFFVSAFRGYLIRRFLSHPLISTIGGMCYTIYLVHLPLLEAITPGTTNWISTENYFWYLMVQIFICIPIIFLFSAFAFLAFERPFMDKNWPLKMQSAARSFIKINPKKLTTMRNLFKNKVLWGILFFLLPFLSLAQNSSGENINFNSFQLQPLPALIQAAMEKAPGLKIQDYMVDNRVEQIRLMRRDWLDNLQFAGNYLLNNGLFMDAIETFNNNAYSLTSRKNLVYNVGIVFKLPVGKVVNRSKRIQLEQNEMQIEMLRKEELQMEIKNTITELYQEIRLQQDMLRIRTESLETNKIALKLAETYFQQGEESLEIYSRAINQKTRSEEELAQTKNRLLVSILFLEELCGRKVIIE